MESTGIIIQARLGSTRMPKKVVKPFYNEESILDIQIASLQSQFPELPIILATSERPENDALADVAKRFGIFLFRGSEEDVLQRFIAAADEFGLSRVVRICSDNPLLHIDSIKLLLHQHTDYAAYALSDGTPTIKTHYGFWPEVVRVGALRRAADSTKEPFYHEHVTNYLYTNPDRFSLHFEEISQSVERETGIRTTIDTEADFNNISALYADLMEDNISSDPVEIVQYIVNKPGYLATMKTQIELNSK